jgi:hypothetical protein
MARHGAIFLVRGSMQPQPHHDIMSSDHRNSLEFLEFLGTCEFAGVGKGPLRRLLCTRACAAKRVPVPLPSPAYACNGAERDAVVHGFTNAYDLPGVWAG